MTEKEMPEVSEESALSAAKKAPSHCAACGTPFVCGVAAGHSTCWCMEKPTAVFEPVADAACYCAACLDERIAAAATPIKPINASAT